MVWVTRLDEDHGNIRAALSYMIEEGDATRVAAFVGNVIPFWLRRGYLTEGRAWIAKLLSNPELQNSQRASLLASAATFAIRQGDFSAADSSLTDASGLNDFDDAVRGHLLTVTGGLRGLQSRFDDARRCFEDALTIKRALSDQRGIADCLSNLGVIELERGDYEGAAAAFRELVPIFEAQGRTAGMADTLRNLAVVSERMGDRVQARQYNERALDLHRSVRNDAGISASLIGLAEIATADDRLDEADELFHEARGIQSKLNDRLGISDSTHGLGVVAARRGHAEEATQFLCEALRGRIALGDHFGMAESLEALGQLSGHDPARGVFLLGAASAMRARLGVPLAPASISDHEVTISRCREGLGSQAFGKKWEEGADAPEEVVLRVAMSDGASSSGAP